MSNNLDTRKRKIISKRPIKILVIPDMQVKPDIDLRFAYAIGGYIAAKQPDVVVNLGDMADMASLSSYDKGKRSAEGKRYKADIGSVTLAQELLWRSTHELNKTFVKQKKPLYDPLRIFLMGNHEDRINRATETDPSLYGTLDATRDLHLKQHWDEVHEFMEVMELHGICFSHYFGSGVMNKACSTAKRQLSVTHASSIAGHQPGRQSVSEKKGNGRLLTAIIAGSAYDYDLDYMGPQGNKHWRGIIMLHNAWDSQFDELYVPIDYLKSKYSDHLNPIVYNSKAA